MEAAGGDGGAMDHMADGGEEVFFRGSISEAIVRAQGSDLVLIVFVSGENEESVSMELTTFRDAAVLDEVKKESLILRLQEGSTDAAYFQAICNSTREDIPVQSSSTTVEGSSMDVDLPEPTEVARSPVYPEAQPIPDAGSLTVETRDGRAPGGITAADTTSSAPKPEPLKSSSSEALKSSSSEDSKTAQNQAKTAVKQGNGKKTTLRREPSGGTKPVKVRTGPFLLQVRLTNGETIQGTFESCQLLRDVKNFIDLQRTDGSMEFRLAIPFPRKLFSEEGCRNWWTRRLKPMKSFGTRMRLRRNGQMTSMKKSRRLLMSLTVISMTRKTNLTMERPRRKNFVLRGRRRCLLERSRSREDLPEGATRRRVSRFWKRLQPLPTLEKLSRLSKPLGQQQSAQAPKRRKMKRARSPSGSPLALLWLSNKLKEKHSAPFN